MMMLTICIALFVVAVLYSTVGHGGASGYTAVLSLAGFSALLVRQDSLVLNAVVSTIAFVQYYRGGHFQLKYFLPFVIASAPMAFLGGSLKIDPHWMQRILGALLLIAAILFLSDIKPSEKATRRIPLALSLAIGAMLGFVSGLTGIGGGVFLSPILILGRWSTQKQTAAISAPFILVNSISGLLGIHHFESAMFPDIYVYLAVCVLGGLAGGYTGSLKLNPLWMKRVLALVLIIASLKLLSA